MGSGTLLLFVGLSRNRELLFRLNQERRVREGKDRRMEKGGGSWKGKNIGRVLLYG